MDQIVGVLPDRALANLRVAARCIWLVTLEAWKDRVMQDKDGSPALTWAVKNDHSYLIRYILAVSQRTEKNCHWETVVPYFPQIQAPIVIPPPSL